MWFQYIVYTMFICVFVAHLFSDLPPVVHMINDLVEKIENIFKDVKKDVIHLHEVMHNN